MEKRELQENLKDLCDLIQAVENRNADQAQKIAQNHVTRFNRYMKKRERAENVPRI
jgi:DNA-binding FadR family transcriptional regulator